MAVPAPPRGRPMRAADPVAGPSEAEKIARSRFQGDAARSAQDAGRARDTGGDARFCRRRAQPRIHRAVYDHLGFVHGLDVYLEQALHEHRRSRSTRTSRRQGAADNKILMFSELMRWIVFLTANTDTVYYLGIMDLTSWPMVVKTRRRPSGCSTTCGGDGSSTSASGPDRGQGGRSLLVPPATRARCPTAATTSGARAPRGRFCRRSFLAKTTPRRPSTRSSAR